MPVGCAQGRVYNVRVPLHNVPDAYLAAREQAAVLNRSHRGKLLARGADRAAYLQGLLTNDIVALQPGMGCYAAYLTPQGRMISDMRVTELGNELLIDLPAVTKETVLERLREFVFSEDVQFVDATESLSVIGVHGPRAADIVSAAVTVDSSALRALVEHGTALAQFSGEPAHVTAAGYLGLPGFDMCVASGRFSRVWSACEAAGALELGVEAAEMLRIEAGIPSYPEDMDQDTIPLEAGIEARAISSTKGCYVGQEVIVRVQHRGHGRVSRRLVGLRAEGDVIPARGAELFDADKKVGHVTSATFSPAAHAPLALGYVRRELVEPGSVVMLEQSGQRVPATVVKLPLLLQRA